MACVHVENLPHLAPILQVLYAIQNGTIQDRGSLRFAIDAAVTQCVHWTRPRTRNLVYPTLYGVYRQQRES